jgi:hypothetical protein
MGGICNTCKYFRAEVYPGEEKPHHCDFQGVALSESESRQNCDEWVPQS